MKPVVAIYSTFLQRAYDQLIHDVALQNLPVVFRDRPCGHRRRRRRDALRRVRPDLPALRAQHDGDDAVRRERVPADALHRVHARHAERGSLSARHGPGGGDRIADDRDADRQSGGAPDDIAAHEPHRDHGIRQHARPALAAAEELDATVANMRFVKPLDTELVSKLAREHDALVTIEENVIAGGAGSAVAEALASAGIVVPVLQLGLPDAFVDHGDPAKLLAECGLDAPGIVASVNARFGPASHRPARQAGGLTRLARRRIGAGGR
jgi:1-deoxy-D-xylulose-5-phosphate synthase